MWQAVRENPRAVLYAVLMHVGLLILLVFSLDWTPKAIKPGSNKPIQAELVDASKLKAVKQKKQAEQQKLAEEKRKLEQDKQRKAEQAVKQKADAERKKQAKVEASKKAEAERKQQAVLAEKKKAQAEQKKKAEQVAKQKAAKEKAVKEKAVKEKAAKEKAAKAKAAADARQREAEQALQAQLAEEQAQAQAEHALSQYIPYIQEKIQRSWIRPVGSAQGMSCLILVKLIPGGEVVDATVVRSSGDPLFDRSVETAVLKASPLPLPEDATLFKYFREINFNFNPDS